MEKEAPNYCQAIKKNGRPVVNVRKPNWRTNYIWLL